MSNVLIGIIGVILFIGLALAGALFLGPRFQESTNNSKAAAIVQHLAQVSSAFQMRNVQTGVPMSSLDWTQTTNVLATEGYLKSAPNNPLSGAGYTTNDENGGIALAVKIVKTELGAGDKTSVRAVCAAIDKQTGGTGLVDTTDFIGTINAKSRAGCFVYTPQNIAYAYTTV